MRAVISFWALAAMTANAQNTWEWQSFSQGQQVVATDAVMGPASTIVTSVAYSGQFGDQPAASRINLLDAFGDVQQTAGFPLEWSNVRAHFVQQNLESQMTVVGGAADQASQKGVFAFSIAPDLTAQWGQLVLFDGFQYTQALSGLVRADGSTIIGGGGQVTPGFFNRAILVALDNTGQVVADTVYGITPDMAVVRQVALWNDQVWMTVDGGGLDEFEGSGGIRAFRLNDDLTAAQWFTMAYLDQDPEPPFDSIPWGTLDFVPISASRFATSGHFGPILPPRRRAAVLVSDSLATIQRLFLPRSTYPMDQPPFMQALSMGPDGNLFFAMLENAQLGPPSVFSVYEPNRIHVYKLDTSLNVLCEHILDGFAENAYYYLNRIKATDDGGFLLLGARRDFNDPGSYFAAWARKFSSLDCAVEVAELPAGQPSVVMPNPGREGFSMLLGGEAINGTLQVMDALGRLVGSSVIRQGQTYFDAQLLGSGLYVYQARDGQGLIRATGRWVKE